ncbi:MAG: hypothetical protein JSV98_09300 [candidate division WOR-3 bacterium]|nr:MAG: hypothetical protein JSV98_09300 [candidate division WOR-3 bacterium]
MKASFLKAVIFVLLVVMPLAGHFQMIVSSEDILSSVHSFGSRRSR